MFCWLYSLFLPMTWPFSTTFVWDFSAIQWNIYIILEIISITFALFNKLKVFFPLHFSWSQTRIIIFKVCSTGVECIDLQQATDRFINVWAGVLLQCQCNPTLVCLVHWKLYSFLFASICCFHLHSEYLSYVSFSLSFSILLLSRRKIDVDKTQKGSILSGVPKEKWERQLKCMAKWCRCWRQNEKRNEKLSLKHIDE